jgi:hypothetical protein
MRFATIDQSTGFVTAILETRVEDNLYSDGAVIFGYLYKNVADIGIPDNDVLNTYFNGIKFIAKPERPSKHHIWSLETEKWLEPKNYVDILKSESLPLINTLAGKKITATLPLWKQSNLNNRELELILKGQANWTPGETGEFTEIRKQKEWLKGIVALSNSYCAKVDSAVKPEQVHDLMAEYKAKLA